MTGRIPIAVVAVGVSVLLWATGVLSLGDALAGFGDPTVVFIACLFIVSEALAPDLVIRHFSELPQAVRQLTGGETAIATHS